MKALSLRQPWAWAVAHAGKRIENRIWKSLAKGFAALPDEVRGQVIAIHASATKPTPDDVRGVMMATGRYDGPIEESPLPPEAIVLRGAIVAVARVVDVLRCTDPARVTGGTPAWPTFELCTEDAFRVGAGGSAVISEEIARWWLGPYALVFADVVALERPIKGVSGMLGFWTVPADTEALLRDQVVW